MFEEYKGRLREIRTYSRQTHDGKGYITFKVLIVELPFNKKIDIKIGKLGLIETIKSDIYDLAEVVDIIPMDSRILSIKLEESYEKREKLLKEIGESWNFENLNKWFDIYMILTNYIVIYKNNSLVLKKGYEPPLVGTTVFFLDDNSYLKLVGSNNGVVIGRTLHSTAEISIDLEKTIKYHIGIFGFTGSGKSNLISLLLRKILNNINYSKLVVFDISAEYSILILDKIANDNAVIITADKLPNSAVDVSKRFLKTHVIPSEITEFGNIIKKIVEKIYNSNKIKKIEISQNIEKYLTYRSLIKMINDQIEDKYISISQRPLYLLLLKKVEKLMKDKKLSNDDIIDESLIDILNQVEIIARESKVKENSNIINFIYSLRSYIDNLKLEDENESYDIEKLAIDILDTSTNTPRLFIIELNNIEEARILASQLIDEIFRRRRKSYSYYPVLFIFDEAQEFIPFDTKGKEKSEHSSMAIEKLLRHGRKYNLHALIATQRLAYLNTNVLQQIHTYFIGTLPRPYDRQLIADTFGLSDNLLDRTLSLEPGEWLLLSFRSALPHDIPIFIKVENNLEEVKRYLEGEFS
jgi:DNA helicase HerA-like ATPase